MSYFYGGIMTVYNYNPPNTYDTAFQKCFANINGLFQCYNVMYITKIANKHTKDSQELIMH